MNMSVEDTLRTFIESNNIYVFHFNDGPITKVFANDKFLWNRIKHMINENFMCLVVGENCVIVSILCSKHDGVI